MKRLANKLCPFCEEWFEPLRGRVTYCSKRCAINARLGKQKGEPNKHRGRPVGECLHCHRTVTMAGRMLCYPCYRNKRIRKKYPKGHPGPCPAMVSQYDGRELYLLGVLVGQIRKITYVPRVKTSLAP